MEIQPEGHRPPEPAETRLRVESWALWMGLGWTLAGTGIGLIAFSNYRPNLAGTGSVAVYAAAVSACAATAGSLAGYLRILVLTQPWLRGFPLYRQVTNAVALVIIHAAISVMAALVSFRIFQDSFLGLTVDRYAGGLMVGVCAGIAGYVALTSAARLTAQSLATLLAVFLATGVFISMLAAENPLWWTGMFSTLGTWQSGQTSFWTFNVTLVVSGLVLSTLTAFIVRDLSLMARLHDDFAKVAGRPPARFMRPRPAVVRVCLLGVGICTTGIGLVPLDVAEPVHSWLARLAVGFIAVLLLGAAVWLPGFPVAFHLFTVACLLGIVGAGLLWRPLRYYDLTAFELAIVGTMIGWLAVFVRTTSAALAVDERALERAMAGNG
ncbi:hypothetical protein ACSYDW_05575 [Paeniglutamicibacter sp. R2-26]|uniref:hypothetical protein n=1 Tax=Paeniglutamicibacter sp. R2-26 TaxID=3144417 RepID=UPI003EE4E5CC